jgi:hypothetical protein
MKEVVLRNFIRNYKSYMPLPKEGIKVLWEKGEDFYVIPVTSDVKNLDQQVDDWQRVTNSKQLPTLPSLPELPCEANKLMPWENCSLPGESYMVADTSNGEPMPSDWREIHLCKMHKAVAEGVGGFEIEEK